MDKIPRVIQDTGLLELGRLYIIFIFHIHVSYTEG